jgi:hypothetical protein
MQGFEKFPSPSELAAKYQKVGNEHFPPPAIARRLRDVDGERRIAVRVRIEWERDGEQWIDAEAWRWDQRHVFVRFSDERLQIGGVWLAPHDVSRPEEPQVSEPK